jgi:class 3 adenylate cyclase
MLLKRTEEGSAERRYDRETLGKVTALAERLQSRQAETLSARDIEAIGTEVGLEPAFVRQALAELAAESRPAVAEPRPSIDSVVAARRVEFRSMLAAWSGALLAGLVALIGAGSPAWVLFWAVGAVLPLAVLLGFLAGKKGAAFTAGFALICALAPALQIAFGIEMRHGPLPFLPYIMFGGPLAGWLARQGAKLREYYSPLPEPKAALPAAPVSRPALLSLLFALQRQLEGQKQRRAFLSVDVVGSSEMKRGAPELSVEYSFTRYRAWIEEVVRRGGGEIQSAAGDGAMCLFVDDGAAIRAARQLQEGVAAFNASHNRLPVPFRLRCGASAGEVVTDPSLPLSHLHSPVIDRAAALQKAAAPGDILVGAELAAAGLVELGALAAAAAVVDGEPAFSWRAGDRASLPPGPSGPA